MKCNFCFKNEGEFKIRVYKEIWEKRLRNDKLIATIFICKKCLNNNKFKFNTMEINMIRIEDYSDVELRDELVDRGYAVYKGKDMLECIEKLEGLQDGLLMKLNKVKGRK